MGAAWPTISYSQRLDVRAHVIFFFLTKIGEKRWNLLLSGETIISNTYSNKEQAQKKDNSSCLVIF